MAEPLEDVWRAAAERIGLSVAAGHEVAQVVLHELCHTLVEGRDSVARSGSFTCDLADWREHAALRVQYVLCRRHGLGDALSPATPLQGAWGALADDVLANRTSRAVRGALVALRRSDREPWAPALHEALAATARLLGVTPPVLHPTGRPLGALVGTCGTCAWRSATGTRSVCVQVEAKVRDAWPACEDYEPVLDCQDCGACCRGAFDAVAVTADDPAVQRLPQLVVINAGRYELRREGDRCAALAGGADEPYRCTVYEDRPATCRDFTAGLHSCLSARRALGLTR